jgi:RNA-binding protein Musashi
LEVEIKRDHEEARQDPSSKRHRGFGFVTFESSDSAVSVLTHPIPHLLDDKKIDPKPAELKPAAPRPMQMGMNQPSGGEDCEKKMFVGGILAGTTVEHVRDYFIHTYGVTVIEVEFKHDKATQRMRGFGFVTLDSPEQVTRVCQKRYHEINGKSVEVKKAQPRQSTASGMALAQMRQSQQSVSPYGYQGYGTDYSQTNGQAYQQAFYSNGQYYGYDTTAAAQAAAAAAAGYGQYGGAAAGGSYAGYDPSAYAHSQSSGGSRQSTQNYYQQHGSPYGHSGAQQLQTSGYRQDASAYTAARTTNYTSQDAAAYGGQSAYGGGGASTGAQQPTGHYQPGNSSYGNQ